LLTAGTHLHPLYAQTLITLNLEKNGIQKIGMQALVCKHCHQCAFCEPLYDECWLESHLPFSLWTTKLDEKIKMPGVLGSLETAGINVKHVKKSREGYRTIFCKRAPTYGSLPDETPKIKRQCTISPTCVSTDKNSVDISTDTLRTFNDMLSLPLHVRMNNVITMEDAQHKGSDSIRQRLHGYISHTLDVLVPGQGEAVYKFMREKQIQTTTTKHTRDFDVLVESMVHLVTFGKNSSDRRLSFVQLCGTLSLNDLNRRIDAKCHLHSTAEAPYAKPISRKKYKVGGTPLSEFSLR
jgi:hypothetical protein